MTVTERGKRATRAEVLAELEGADRFLLVTHEHPDGDALGSLLAMHEVLRALGKDSVMFMAADELPLPYEYRFFAFDGLVSRPPDDVAERTVVFLDCGNIDRNPAEALQLDDAHIVNLDHHHDNTHFGTVNHVVPEASCTAEVVWDLMHGLGVVPTVRIAEALYVGLVTDTGKFMYENTGTRAHVMAAELIEAGVDVHDVYHRIYEGVPYAKVALLARALGQIERYDDGRLALTRLTRADFAAAGAEENYSEGVVDHLRAIEGTAVAALVRDRLGSPDPEQRKVSLRASTDRVDVSAIAREQGGGGHRQAAGFSSEATIEDITEFVRREFAAARS
jgi:bifunctional oligoribonuclease and PAP phosphatase NrnA